jgi:Peptidase S46
MRLSALAPLLAVAVCLPAVADEGMWTFDNPPARFLKDKYNFTPSQAWLDHIRLSSVRLNDGGSGSFVSAHGLLLTNHHVARGQLQKNSTAEHNYIDNGFYAATPDQEMKSPDLEINILVSMENVTSRVQDAVKASGSAEKEFAARRAVIAQIEKESEQKTSFRSDVVSLYAGGEYWLYRYKRYTDVRLVFAPEQQAAFYGGDPDNFTYPRYDLDMALFRVYENNKPIDSKDFLKWNPKGAAADELVFVSGHPGTTQRLDTMSQLTYQGDIALPTLLKMFRRRISLLKEYSAQGADQAREAGTRIFGLENTVKVFDNQIKGLQDPAVMAQKRKEEEDFKAKAQISAALAAIAAAEKKAESRKNDSYFHSLDSDLYNLATSIIDYVVEIKKPDGERLPGYHDAQLQSLRFRMASPAPVYKRMDIMRITGAVQYDRENAGAGDAFVKTVLNGQEPATVASALVNGTKLEDPAVRKQLMDGGEAAVNASTDPMILLALKLAPMRREFIKWSQDNVQSVEQKAGEELAKARFTAYGKNAYPDATFTLRLSYGQVKGFPMNGTIAPPVTTMYGLYDRAESFGNKPPFNLPARFAEGRTKLNLATPFDFVTTNDITGGNSGSPVINAQGDIVGLIFDGNIESIVGDFVYDINLNRAVAVHTAAMTEALTKLYNAKPLVEELLGSR